MILFVPILRRFHREAMSLATVSIGGVQAYALVAVVPRVLPEADAALFFVIWTVATTVLIALFSPIEALAPRLVLLLGDAVGLRYDFVIVFHFFVLVLAVPLASFSVFYFSSAFTLTLIASVCVYVAAYAYWSLVRSSHLGVDSMSRLPVQASAVALVWFVLVGIGILLLPLSVPAILLVNATALCLGSIAAMGRLSLRTNLRDSAKRSPWREYFGVAASGALMMLPVNIGIIFSDRLGVSDREIVTYAAFLALVRGLYTVVNAASAALSVRYALAMQSSDWAKLQRISTWHVAAFAASVLAASVLTLAFGTRAVQLMTGYPSALPSTILLIIALGEGVLAAAVVPRMILIVIGVTRGMNIIWSVAVAAALVFLFLPIDATVRISAAPLIAGAVAVVCLGAESARAVSRGRRATVSVGGVA